MDPVTLTLPGGQTLTYDPANPGAFAQALSAHIGTQTAAAVAPIQTELDAALGALADEAVNLRTRRLGADNVDADALRVRLGNMTAAQVSDFIRDERAELSRTTDANANRSTSDAAPETPAAALAPEAGDNPFAPYPVRSAGAAATVAGAVAMLALAILSAFGSPAMAATAPDAVVVERHVDAPVVTVAAADVEPGTLAPPAVSAPLSAATGTPGAPASVNGLDTSPARSGARSREFRAAPSPSGPSAPSDRPPDRGGHPSPWGGLFLALPFVGVTVFDFLRSHWGACRHVVGKAPAGGWSGGDVVQVGGLWGFVREDTAAGDTVMVTVETDDAGIVYRKAAGVMALGQAIYWDADGNPVGGVAGSGALTTDAAAGANPFMGYALDARIAADTDVRFMKKTAGPSA